MKRSAACAFVAAVVFTVWPATTPSADAFCFVVPNSKGQDVTRRRRILQPHADGDFCWQRLKTTTSFSRHEKKPHRACAGGALSTTSTALAAYQYPALVWETVGTTLLSSCRRVLEHGSTTFLARWKTYSLIPIIAGLVGWFTNYLAVKMIFHPIQWRGIPIWRPRADEQPLGLIGWQGIVPAKTMKMSEAMVNATITQLLSMDEMIQRLDPATVAEILLPQANYILQPMVADLVTTSSDDDSSYRSVIPAWLGRSIVSWTSSRGGTSPTTSNNNNNLSRMSRYQKKVTLSFLQDLTAGVQANVNRVLNLRNCVVEQMMADRSLLGKLFQISGKKELAFLTDSGLVFGFMLGILQLLVALYWDNPWSLSIGGCIVGLATNWLALKWIFEPVKPTQVGPLVLQGLFLRRQAEVSADFSKFFSTKVLTSEQLWKSILTDPTTKPHFTALFAQNVARIAREESNGLIDLERNNPKPLYFACKKATETLSDYLSNDLHEYIDQTLDIERTLRTRMMAMSSEQFERVLHPIFEEDELTLILAGGGLGFLAGLIQQSLATGSLVVLIPHFHMLGVRTRAMVTGGVVIALGWVGITTLKLGKRIRLFRRKLLNEVRNPRRTFYAIDLDNDGYLGKEEVRHAAYSVLGHESSDVSLEEIFTELDEDNDGYVSLDDFKEWWARTAEDDGFRSKLVRGLGGHGDEQHHQQHDEESTTNEETDSGFGSRWRTIRMRNGKDVRVVWENRRLLLQHRFPSLGPTSQT